MRITVSFSLDDTQDRDLLRWLDQQPPRQRSAAIRAALRSSVGRQDITLADVYQAVQDLKRQGLTFSATASPGQGDDRHAGADEPDDIAAALDNLGL